MTQQTALPNCIVAQSGGPTVAINASLAGVIHASAGHYGTVYGSINGILGILNQNYLNLTELTAEMLCSGLQPHRPCILARAVTN